MMNQLSPVRFLLGLLVLAASALVDAKNDRPNVVLVMTDDQDYGDLGCHGNSLVKTPHLDQLHAESVRFTDFHVSPFCAPTRAALMTGRFANLTGVRATIRGRNHLDVTETAMAEYFKASGYATGHFGKWHLGRNGAGEGAGEGTERERGRSGRGAGEGTGLLSHKCFPSVVRSTDS